MIKQVNERGGDQRRHWTLKSRQPEVIRRGRHSPRRPCGRSYTLVWLYGARAGERTDAPYLIAVRIRRPIAAARPLHVRPSSSFAAAPSRIQASVESQLWSQLSRLSNAVKMFQSVVGILILAAAAVTAQRPPGRCPEDYGVQTYAHEAACDRFYKVREGHFFREKRFRVASSFDVQHVQHKPNGKRITAGRGRVAAALE